MNSEPRVLLLGGNRGRWSAKDRIWDAVTMNGIEAWIFAFGGDYIEGAKTRIADIKGYDIIIANYNFSKAKHFQTLAENRDPSTKWVTLIEGDALDYLKPQPSMREVMDASDLIGSINKHSDSFFKKFSTARAEYIGIPYPAEGIRALATPKKDRRKEIFLAPMMLKRWLEYFAAKDLGIPLYGYEKRLSRTRRTILRTLREHKTMDPWHFHKKAKILYREPQFTIYREEGLPEFFQRNGAAYLWLNLDPRYTWGRYVLDAAALQVPIITTKSTGHGENFFPETTLDNEFEIEKAIELVKRLLTDEEFYRDVTTIPVEKFDHLKPEVKRKELLDILY